MDRIGTGGDRFFNTSFRRPCVAGFLRSAAALNLQAVATLSNGTQQTLSSSVTWQSSASSVITVNPQGYATAVGKGSAQISAAYQALTSNASVTVVAPTLGSVSISPNQVSLPIGETEQLTVTGTYTDGSTQNLTPSVTWTSSGPAVSVNAAGSAVAKAAGSATISATIGAVTGTASITVTPAAVVALNIVPGTLTLSLGSSSQLQAVATMSDGSQQTLSSSIAWQSSPTSIVTVNVQGSVTAVGKGSAQVTGTYQGISGSAAVTVVAPSLVSIAITPNQISLPIGETEQLIATGIYTDGSTQNLTQTATWISSGPTVATVSATGSAFAKTIGSATISATVGAVTGTANISVTPAAVVGLNIVPATLTLPLGSSSQLQAVASMSRWDAANAEFVGHVADFAAIAGDRESARRSDRGGQRHSASVRDLSRSDGQRIDHYLASCAGESHGESKPGLLTDW